MSTAQLTQEIDELGPWFHNLHLGGNAQTAPNHPLGDFPRRVWNRIAGHVPEDLTGWTALDVGCNAGFYAFELARRGARVTAIDHDERYLRQARWAARQLDLTERIEFRQMQVYDLAHHDAQYDLIWFMGVFYHLRYPLLGLDAVARRVRRLMVFQTMTMPGEEVYDPPEDFPLNERNLMLSPGWPVMAFIERRLADDPTNWWSPNHACAEALLRSANMEVLQRIIPETYLCRPRAEPAENHLLLEDEFSAATGRFEVNRREPNGESA